MSWTTVASDSFVRSLGLLFQSPRDQLDYAFGGTGSATWFATGTFSCNIIAGTNFTNSLGVFNGDTVSNISTLYLTGQSPTSNDQAVEWAVDNVNDGLFGPMVRYTAGTGIGTGYFVYILFGNAGIYLFKSLGTSFTLLTNNSTAISATDIIRLEVVGNNLTVLRNGSTELTATDSSYPTATDIGGSIFDNGGGPSNVTNFIYQEATATAGTHLLASTGVGL